jgi:arylsulfatase A-like enzyme
MKYIIAAISPLWLMSCAFDDGQRKSPNVIVVLTDDQGWGDLSFNGNTNLSTPNIDALASAGASFDRFFVSPVCSPTRAEFLTGRYHPRGGVYSTSSGGERLDLDETTIADIFKRAGYATAAYGKWHNGMQPPYHPNARGFDDFYGFCSGHWGIYFSAMLEHNGRMVRGEGYLTDDFTDQALRFIQLNAERPFFLYLPYNTPHSPMQVPDRWYEPFEDRDILLRHRDPVKEDLQFTRAALAMCENIDWNVGRVIQKVKDLGLYENTIFVYFCDNGPNSWRWNGGMKGRKGSTDEGGVRAPLFITWPGVVSPNTVVPEIAAAIDLLPTLADMTNIDVGNTKPLDGVSLKPLLLNTGETWPERYIYNHWAGRVGVRSQRYRLDHEGSLFDMALDPGQNNPVNADFPDVAERLLLAKKVWERDVVARLQKEETRPFAVGFPGFQYTQLPARDGIGHGTIRRSNRWPNCSYFTNWTSTGDSITWDIEVMEAGNYEAELYYTCALENVGSTIVLQYGSDSLVARVRQAHDPPLRGMEHDRILRQESYVKDFKPWVMGPIYLEQGTGPLTLKALHIPGDAVMEVRLMMLKKR